MAYNKTTWSSGDKISAVKLNNIENGVEVLSDSLTNMQNLHVYYKQPADFGGLAEDDIGTMISKMNGYSTVKLWINNSDSFPTIYNWVLAGINADVDASVTYVYGIVTIEVTGSCARIIFEPYDATERYEISYSSVNSVGWGTWVRYNTDSSIKFENCISASVSVPANSEVSVNINLNIPIGKKFIGFIHQMTQVAGVLYEGYTASGNTATVYLYNVGSIERVATWYGTAVYK